MLLKCALANRQVEGTIEASPPKDGLNWAPVWFVFYVVEDFISLFKRI